MAMTRGAGVGMQILAIPFVAFGFAAFLFLLIAAGLSPEGMAALLWPGSAYLGVFFLGLWMLRAGKRAARIKEL